jgi:exosome complex component CSL4
MQLRHESGSMVIPGDRLLRHSTAETTQQQPQQFLQQQPLHIQYVAGEGTYVRNDYIVASIVGRFHVSSTSVPITADSNVEELSNEEDAGPPIVQMVTVSVVPNDGCFRAKQQVVRVGQTILGRVVRIGTTQQQPVMVDIVANPYGVLDCAAQGTIRREDITKLLPSATTGSSTIPNTHPISQQHQQLSQSFRVGDWIAAKVLSLGDDSNRKCYYLTTAESSLGVIYAKCSTSGHAMIPVSNREMECPMTGAIEARKCARPPTIITTING